MNPREFVEAVMRSPKISKESKERLEEVMFFSDYSEPGYSASENGIALGNWNNAHKRVPAPEHWADADDYVHRVAKVLSKRYSVELEWSDEWLTCSDCGNLVRCSPDSYGWQQSYVEIAQEPVCHACAQKYPEDVIDEFDGNERRALPSVMGIDPEKHGYHKVAREFENGFHHGQNDDPKVIAKSLRGKGISRFIFMLDSKGQFDLAFSVFIHDDDWAKFNGKVDSVGVDNAAELKKKLEETKLVSIDPSVCPDFIMNPEHYNPDGSCKCERR